MLEPDTMQHEIDNQKTSAPDAVGAKITITEKGINNLVEQLQDRINQIGLLEKEIQALLETVATEKRLAFFKELVELTDDFYNEEDELNAFLTRKPNTKYNIEQDFKQLQAQLHALLAIQTKYHRLKLNLMVENIDDHFKVEADIRDDKPLLMNVFHTILIAIPQFAEYFKFKKKDAHTDYRSPIKRIKFKNKTHETAMQSLLEHREYQQSSKGQERLLIAEFTELSPIQFSQSFSQYSRNVFHSNSPDLCHIFLPEKKIIIILLRDLHSKKLNIHGFSFKQALENIKDYLRNRFLDFQKDAILIPGKGNHSAKGKPTMIKQLFPLLAKWAKRDKKLIKKSTENPHNTGEVYVEFQPVVDINFLHYESELNLAIRNQEHRLRIRLPVKFSQEKLESFASTFAMQAIRRTLLIAADSFAIRAVPQEKEGAQYVKLFFMYSGDKADLINTEMRPEAHRQYSQVTVNR